MSSSSSVNSSRLLWVVRHGERLDNVDAQWRTNGALPRAQWDDPPLSPRGILQASEVGRHLRGQPIHFIVCSPFSRCLQTTQQIVRQLAQQQQPNLAVLIEPGFCESLNVCQSPPGFPGMDEIRQSFSDLPIDTNYQPYFRPEDLPTDERTNFCCFRRVIGTLKHILDRVPGNLLIVSHGSPISAIHLALSGHLDYMGQCTVSHYRLLGHPAKGQLGGDENAAELAAPAIKYDKTIDNKSRLINSADLPPMSLLPPLGNSIVIRAVPSLQTAACPPANSLPGSDIGGWPAAALAELDANGGDGAPGKRRNTMPVAAGKFRLREVGEERTKDLAVALARLVEAVGTRAEWRPSAECLAAGCSAHLSDRRNLHNRLYM